MILCTCPSFLTRLHLAPAATAPLRGRPDRSGRPGRSGRCGRRGRPGRSGPPGHPGRPGQCEIYDDL